MSKQMTKTPIGGRGYFKLSLELFKQLLDLPEEMEILEVRSAEEWRTGGPYISIEVQSPLINSESSRFNQGGAVELKFEYNEDGTLKDWYYIKYTHTTTEEYIHPKGIVSDE